MHCPTNGESIVWDTRSIRVLFDDSRDQSFWSFVAAVRCGLLAHCAAGGGTLTLHTRSGWRARANTNGRHAARAAERDQDDEVVECVMMFGCWDNVMQKVGPKVSAADEQ